MRRRASGSWCHSRAVPCRSRCDGHRAGRLSTSLHPHCLRYPGRIRSQRKYRTGLGVSAIVDIRERIVLRNVDFLHTTDPLFFRMLWYSNRKTSRACQIGPKKKQNKKEKTKKQKQKKQKKDADRRAESGFRETVQFAAC